MHVAGEDRVSDALPRALCAVVIVTMILAVLYAAWIAAVNFSRIGV